MFVDRYTRGVVWVTAGILPLLLLFSMAGCEDDYSDLPLPTSLPSDDAANTPAADEAAKVVGPPPHGGDLMPLGDDEAYVEWLHEADATTATFHVLDKALEPVKDVGEAALYLTSPAGPETLEIEACEPEGPGYCGTVESAGLASENFRAILRIVVDGKRYRILLRPPAGAESKSDDADPAMPSPAVSQPNP